MAHTLTAYGLYHLEDKVVDIMLDGVDCGTATVANGAVSYTLTAEQYADFDGDESVFSVGINIVARGQLLPPQAGPQNGVGTVGKVRRVDQFAMLVSRCSWFRVGPDFTTMDDQNMQDVDTDGKRPLFSGTVQGGVSSTYDFENMIAWEQNRPGPGTFLAVAGFVTTQDR